MPDTFTTWLRALTDHLEQHPELDPITTNVTAAGRYVQLYPKRGGTDLGCLTLWARTLEDLGPVRISAYDPDNGLHLEMYGHLADGVRVGVVAVVHQAEAELLAANALIHVGAEFPVELLDRITSAPVAEQVPA